MIRTAAAPKAKHQSHLDQLRTAASLWRGSKDAKRRPPQTVRDEAITSVRAGVPAVDVAAAIGMTAWTVARWVKTAASVAAIRELKLVASPPERQENQLASVRLPNGICLDVPTSALTASFIGQLLAAGGMA